MHNLRQQVRADARARAFHEVTERYGLEPRRYRRRIARGLVRRWWKRGAPSQGKFFGAAAIVTTLLALLAPQARAQGARKDDVVINGAGQPVGGASVAICNSTATIGTSTTPCSPLATIYTDATLATPAANPFTADGLGNYGFWAPPGTYQVQVYGPQIATTLKTVVLPCVPGSSCAGGGGSSPNAAMKPGASDAVQYVSPNGNDSNDGLSMGTAKLTIMGAYDTLGQGGGTIYITGSSTSYSSCTSTAGQGIWIMGSADPNYSSPPAGWRKMKLGGPVYFVGLSANTSPAASTTSWTTIVNCGNNTNPGVWLSGVSGVTISRLRMVSESARVSMDSNGGRNNATNPSAQIEFDHDDFRSDCSTCGPAMDVGGNMLWLNVHDSTFENGAIANWSVSANSSQASNISISNGGGSGPIGLLYFTQNFFSGGGGLRFDANTNSSASVYAAHTLMEGAGACQPVYEIINGGTFAATFDVQGGFSDCGASPPFVKVAAGNQPCQTSVRGINQGGQVPGLEGPLTVGDAICPGGNPSSGVSTSDAGVPSAGVIPAAKGQSGGTYGTSQNADAYRRSFAPSLVRFANTANQLPSTWTAYQGSGQTLTPIQGPGDPAGSTNAATLSCTGQSGFGCSYYAFDSNITFNAGDYVYVGAWMQAASTAGFGSGSAIGVIFPFGNNPTMRQMTGGPAGVGGAFSAGTTQLSSSPYFQNDGNWQYVWGLSKVTAPFSGASGTVFAFAFQPGYPINVYAPMFIRIPASSVAVVSAPTFSSASESGNIVTFTTSAAHNLSRGEPIVLSGCSVGGYNGEFVLGNTISSTTFTVYNSATGLGSPTGCVITPENDSEVADWANNLKPYSDKCSTGVLCGVVSNPAISASGLNNIVFVDGVMYTTIQAAVNALPSCTQDSVMFSHCGSVWVPNSTTIASGQEVSVGPWVQIHFLPQVLITYTGSGTAFTCADAPTSYSGGGGIYDLHLVGTSSGAAGILNNECTWFHLEHVEVQGFTAGAGILYETTQRWTEETTWIDVRASNNAKNVDFQDNCAGHAGCGSFAYSHIYHAVSTPNSSTDGYVLENDSILTGDVDLNCFLLQSAACLHLKNTSVLYSARGFISSELTGGATSANGIKTDSGTQFYPNLFGESYVGAAITDSFASGTVGGSSTTSSIMVGGGLKFTNLLLSATAPTISSGFGTSPSIVQQNGTAAFEVNVGTGGSATNGVIGLPTAANGWSCTAIDMNTNDVTRETAFTTTSVTLTAASAWIASDKLLVNCAAF